MSGRTLGTQMWRNAVSCLPTVSEIIYFTHFQIIKMLLNRIFALFSPIQMSIRWPELGLRKCDIAIRDEPQRNATSHVCHLFFFFSILWIENKSIEVVFAFFIGEKGIFGFDGVSAMLFVYISSYHLNISDFICSRSIGQPAEHDAWKRKIKVYV